MSDEDKNNRPPLGRRVLKGAVRVAASLLVIAFMPFIVPLAMITGLEQISSSIALALFVVSALIGIPALVILAIG